MRRVIAYVLALVLAVVAVAVGVRVIADHSSLLDRFKGDEGATLAPGPTTPSGPAPGPGQSFVTGMVDTLSAEGAQGAPLAAPFTFTSPDRGVGRVTIQNALVDGKRTSIAWGGGTPLPITGAGSIDLSGSRVDVDATGTTWKVDGAVRALAPGRYRAAASVAVGVGGLAAPRDSVDFTADAMTLVQSTGGVVVKVPPAKLEVTGPGKVTAAGQLQIRDPQASRAASSIQFGEGPYRVTLTPAAGRLTVDAVLQGPLTRG
ncbi:MAG: hypothetical protein M3066_11090 [Actinomycetota bacterium]|nr:hypothetical protein [Actinomycetota bacterium]